jgi:hypothetical protein
VSTLRLRFLTGPRRGQQIASRGPRVRIGRSRDNDIILDESDAPQSSGHHAEAVLERGRWWIRDLGSTNGSWLNGVRIEHASIRTGDTLAFGDAKLAVDTRRSLLVPALIVLVLVVGAGLLTLWLRTSRPNLQTAVATIARSTYLIAIEDASTRRALGTAFVVSADTLATNAHVAEGLHRLIKEKGGRGVAVRSDSSNVQAIIAIELHNGWHDGSIADDVAIVRIQAGEALMPLALADDSAVARLPRGTELGTFGFPGSEVDPRRPRGRLMLDVLGDVLDGRYLAVGLAIIPGTSGSPIFLPDGTVVGLVAGGEFVKGLTGTSQATSGVNWGISIAALRELLAKGGRTLN